MLTLLVYAVLLSAVLVVAGFYLTIVGDRIADETGFGESLVGFIMLAAITSLPELSTSLSAAAIGQANLVAGNIFGSNLFNLSIIAVMVMFLRKRGLPDGDSRNVLTGSFGIALASVVGLGMLTEFAFAGEVLVAAYIVTMFLNYRFERRQLSITETGSAPAFRFRALWRTYLFFLVLGVVVVVCGYLMTVVCDQMAVTPFTVMGNRMVLGRTFVGQLFLAIATSLPEMIVTFSAVRIGKVNMAYANIFGSNIFNLAILGVAGITYSGNMFAGIGIENMLTLFIFMLMASISIAAMKYRPVRQFRFDAVIMILLFLMNLVYVFNR